MTTVDAIDAPARSREPAFGNSFVEFARTEIERTLHGRFERIVTSHGDRPAVVTRTEQVTYRALNAAADRIARAIIARAGTEAEPVALLFQQGCRSIAATLGTLKAGKFFVPLDTHLPIASIAALLEDSQARLIVTDARNLPLARELSGIGIAVLDVEQIGSDVPSDTLDLSGSADALAYIYYTSGSTGAPKGVMDTHRNVLHNIMRYTNRLRICADDRMTLLQGVGFSGAVSSLFGALLNGASVFPVELREETPYAIAKWFAAAGITIYHSVPSLFRAVLAQGTALPSVRLIRLEGDRASVADVELYREHFAPECRLVNGLGTTETGIVCQYFVDRTTILDGGRLPVGYPNDDVEIRILCDGSVAAEAGQVGEIAVVSRYLSPGYWRNPTLTQRAFTPEGRNERRMYRTGDLGRLRPDGCVEYLGRNDRRVKIRGQWVALADVESALLALEQVGEAVVTMRAGTDEARLVAYIVPSDGEPPSVSELRRSVASLLPAHMVPASYVMLSSLPLSHNGKIDRQALPPPPQARPRLTHEWMAPESALQIRIAQVWEEVLGIHPVGIRDDFLDLGGDSLAAAVMLSRLEDIFDRRIPLSMLLEAADIETLADALFQHNEDLRFPILHIQPGGSKPPLFFLHGDYLSGGFYCLELARHLGPDQPFHVLPPYGLDDRPVPMSYELMAAQHVETLRAFKPNGPYRLGGICNGGLIAFEMARRLVDDGQQVDLVLLVGSSAENVRFRRMKETITAIGETYRLPQGLQMALYAFPRWIALELSSRRLRSAVIRLFEKVRNDPRELIHRIRAIQSRLTSDSATDGGRRLREQRRRLRKAYLHIDCHYIPERYANPVTLLWPQDDPQPAQEAAQWWEEVAAKVDLHVVPGTHIGSLTADVKCLAEHLRRCLAVTPS